MSNNPLKQLSEYGQSFWFDNIHRGMITSGELDRMIAEDDLRGITSNPSIFEKAITGSDEYDAQIAELLKTMPDKDDRGYFFELAMKDIRDAADKLKTVYDSTNGLDGYVSLEVSPDLAHDIDASIDEAKALFKQLDRPNIMIKIPATLEGVTVVEELIAEGINVNATLLFSTERYREIAKAYIRGIKRRKENGQAVDHIASVASFFVSRVDTNLDKALDECVGKSDSHDELHGQLAILNAKSAYLSYQDLFETQKYKDLGAPPQRLLWASTGTKNPDYPDTLYIDQLIGPSTVSTIPPATCDAFKDHGTLGNTLLNSLPEAPQRFNVLREIGVNVEESMQILEDEGVETFAKSFDNLLQAIAQKRTQLKNNAA